MIVKKFFKNAACMVALPIAVYILMQIICLAAGKTGFGVGADFVVIIRNSIYTGCIALAVSYNLTSGRFDFSVGATLLLACIFGGKLVLATGLSGFGAAVFLLAACLVFGGLLGAINGVIYTTLGLPPMIFSLGVCMIYEAIGYVFSNGAGVSILGHYDLLVWSTGPHIYVLIAVILAMLFVLLNYTKFGYNTRSLQKGQEISVEIGVNEKKNVILCYLLAGVLLAAAGVINMCVYAKTDPSTGLSSISYIENAFLPMFIGGALAKYGDRNLGVIMGAITQATLTAAFGKLGLSTSLQSILSGVIVILFFVYSGNAYKLIEVKMFREKRQLALTAKKNSETRKV